MPNTPPLIHNAPSGKAPVFEPSAGIGAEPALSKMIARATRLVTGSVRSLSVSEVNKVNVIATAWGFYGS